MMDPRIPLDELNHMLGKLSRQAKATSSLTATVTLDEISYMQNRLQATRLAITELQTRITVMAEAIGPHSS